MTDEEVTRGLETPEEPRLPPRQALRRQPSEVPLETPEYKPLDFREKLGVPRRAQDVLGLVSPEDPPDEVPEVEAELLDVAERVAGEYVEAMLFDGVAPEVLELHLHVAQNPVNAHAPAWTGREPNSP